jgi:AraC-like DNA-binding protein
MKNWDFLYFSSHYLPLLYAPLTFLFVKHLLTQKRVQVKELLHFTFVPVVLLIIYFSMNSTATHWPENIFFHPLVRYSLLLLSLFTYHFLAFRLWKQYQSAPHQLYSEATMIKLRWMGQFITVSLGTGVIVATALYFLYINYPFGHEYRYAFILLTGVIYWFSYTALTKPVVFSSIKGFAKEETKLALFSPLKVYHAGSKYSNSVLSEEQLEHICASLENLLKGEKLYLKPGLTIAEVAEKLKCSRHHLSQALNEHLKKSYPDYINQCRIDEAVQLLSSPLNAQFKIAAIAYDAGFNSLSTFNEVFKKHTGKTPSDFRNESLKGIQKQRV